MEINCARLGFLQQQSIDEGVIRVGKDDPISPAKMAILKSLGPVEFVNEPLLVGQILDILDVDDHIHQHFIDEARKEAKKSTCWMGGVGCVVVNDDGEIVTRGHNHAVLLGEFCQHLEIDIKKARTLLKTDERLDFCQAIHDVTGVIAKAAREGIKLGGCKWYLSLEPCDNCANSLVEVGAKEVYFSVGIGRERYYNSVGLARLVAAQIPTFFVMMKNE